MAWNREEISTWRKFKIRKIILKQTKLILLEEFNFGQNRRVDKLSLQKE